MQAALNVIQQTRWDSRYSPHVSCGDLTVYLVSARHIYIVAFSEVALVFFFLLPPYSLGFAYVLCARGSP